MITRLCVYRYSSSDPTLNPMFVLLNWHQLMKNIDNSISIELELIQAATRLYYVAKLVFFLIWIVFFAFNNSKRS
jgi:hypothetical protein